MITKNISPNFILGQIKTSAGTFNQISTEWTNKDLFSAIKVRWSFGRMDYIVEPGLYAVGVPDENSDVFISCNYKLSFDHLRRAMKGMNAWILVLNTKGINVWCAAGKGTFGTEELIFRISEHQLEKVIKHNKIIVPQLSAPGVSAYQVKENTGFRVIYGPVKAADIPAFIANGYKATPEMRKINFNFWDRTKLIPVELIYGKYYLFLVPAIFFIFSGFNTHGFSLDAAIQNGGRAIFNLFAAYFAGCVFTPMLLPIIPFKAFSLKGLIMGYFMAILMCYFNLLGTHIIEITAWFLIMGAISSFMAMNFTGSSTFTSLSGVQKEMKIALPLQIITLALGCLIWIVSRFI